MRSHVDRTMNSAVGSVAKEWRQLAGIAVQIRENPRVNPEWAHEKLKLFTGIYKRLLTDPIEEVKEQARYKER